MPLSVFARAEQSRDLAESVFASNRNVCTVTVAPTRSHRIQTHNITQQQREYLKMKLILFGILAGARTRRFGARDLTHITNTKETHFRLFKQAWQTDSRGTGSLSRPRTMKDVWEQAEVGPARDLASCW